MGCSELVQNTIFNEHPVSESETVLPSPTGICKKRSYFCDKIICLVFYHIILSVLRSYVVPLIRSNFLVCDEIILSSK